MAEARLPVLLEDGSSRRDWPGAAYRPEVRIGTDFARIAHRIDGAPALDRLVGVGAARWAAELRCPGSLLARTELSDAAGHEVAWRAGDARGPMHVIPGLVAVRPLRLDALAGSRSGAAPGLDVPAGWWLARGEPRRDGALLARTIGPFREWQRSLVARAGEAPVGSEPAPGRRQRELLAAAGGGPAALEQYLRERLGLGADEATGAPPFPRASLTPDQYRNPSAALEAELAAAWEGWVQRGPAAQPLFWLLCHVEWIAQGRIGGLEEALTLGGRDRTPDQRTRNLLRRTGGLPHVRGAVSVFSDCPLARAWWRGRLAEEAARASNGAVDREAAHRALRAGGRRGPGAVWEALMRVSLRDDRAAINQPDARAALVAALAGRDRPSRAAVQAMSSALADCARTRSLAHIPWDELHAIAVRAVAD